MASWFHLADPASVASPALLLSPALIDRNIEAMVALAGDPLRLRPHVKTYKMVEIVRAQIAAGIVKFKAATIAEAEMAARAGARDVLLAMQPVGPQVARLFALRHAFPDVRFSTLVDDGKVVAALAAAAPSSQPALPLWVDLDVGMQRTGVSPDARALALCLQITQSAGLKLAGLHAYDGHVHATDLDQRTQECEAAFAPVAELARQLAARAMPVDIIAGGTPTFPIHARRASVELSPGTSLLFDHGYATCFPDLPFAIAAVLLTRVVSRPKRGLVTLDLGTKAVASEMALPRVFFPDLPDAETVAHNEEHMVVRTAQADELPPGTVVYAMPTHICPTVNLHDEALIVHDHAVTAAWSIVARARRLAGETRP